MLANDEIVKLLRNNIADEDNTTSDLSQCCNVSYAIFLEPAEDDEDMTIPERIAETAIKTFSPSPVLMHCEVVVPPIPHSDGGKVHFATYMGRGGADWQNQRDKQEGILFYLIQNGNRWRAVPIFGKNAASELREAAETNLHAPYSVAMYLTSAPPLRNLAWMWPDSPKSRGHCAVISARVLKEAGLSNLSKSPAWYSPSTLYNELIENTQKLQNDEPEMSEECTQTIDTLLHSPLSYETIHSLGDKKCVEAIHELTIRACKQIKNGDEISSKIAQKQLASCLLKWCLLRQEHAASPDTISAPLDAPADATPESPADAAAPESPTAVAAVAAPMPLAAPVS